MSRIPDYYGRTLRGTLMTTLFDENSERRLETSIVALGTKIKSQRWPMKIDKTDYSIIHTIRFKKNKSCLVLSPANEFAKRDDRGMLTGIVPRSEVTKNSDSYNPRLEWRGIESFNCTTGINSENQLRFKTAGTFTKEEAPSFIDRNGNLFARTLNVLNRGFPIYVNKDEIKVHGITEDDFYKERAKTSWSGTNYLKFTFSSGQPGEKKAKKGQLIFERLDGKTYSSNLKILKDPYPCLSLFFILFTFNGSILCHFYKNLKYKVIGVDINRVGQIGVTITNSDMQLIDRLKYPTENAETPEEVSGEYLISIFKNIEKKGHTSKEEKICVHYDGRSKSPIEAWEYLKTQFASLDVLELPKSVAPLVGYREKYLTKNGHAGLFGVKGNFGVVVTADQNAEKNCPRGLTAEKVIGEGDLIYDLEVIWALAIADPFALTNTARLPSSVRLAADLNNHTDWYLRALRNIEEQEEL